MSRDYHTPQTRNEFPLNAKQRIGEDIRTAKIIYEKMNNVDADYELVDVNKWLREANDLKKMLGLNTIQQVLEEIIEIPYKIEI